MKQDGTRTSKRELRNFGLTLGGMVVLVFGLALPWLFAYPNPFWPWVVAGAVWAVALILPQGLRPVFKAWMTVGHWLAWINARIILGIMFYTVFLLVGLIMKLTGKDPMTRKFDEYAETYRVRSQQRPIDHVERPF